jgi:hypothetical protein
MLIFSLLFHVENQVCKNELKYLEIMVNKTYEKITSRKCIVVLSIFIYHLKFSN